MAANHAAWDPERHRKPRKKYGHLLKSPYTNLNEMLAEHRTKVTDLLNKETEEWRRERKRREKQDAADDKPDNGPTLGYFTIPDVPASRSSRSPPKK